MTEPTIARRLPARTPMATAPLSFDDVNDDDEVNEVGAAGADAAPRATEAGAPSGENDLAISRNTS